MIKATAAYVSCLILLLTACVTRRADLSPYSSLPEVRESIVKEIEYDEKGRPRFAKTLNKRPAKAGERFTVIWMQESEPVGSYDITVVEQKPDMGRPLKALYTWTGKGFQWGVEMVGHMAVESYQSGPGAQGKEAAVLAAAVVAPIAVGTLTGFAVGVVDGAAKALRESSKIIVNARETVVTHTRYDHDERGRLVQMRMYAVDTQKELVRTEFFYEGGETNPYRTVINSFAEDTVRVIQ